MHSFIQVASFIDKTLDNDPVSASKLFIQVSEKRLQYCILDGIAGRFTVLEDFRLEDGYAAGYQHLNALLAFLERLRLSYGAVIVLIEDPLSTLVPYPLFEESQKARYLEFTYDLPSQCLILSDRLKNLEAVNVFAVPGELHSLIIKYFPACRIIHLATSLIEGLRATFRQTELQGRVFVNVRSEYLDILVFDADKLIFCNSFPYHCREDFLYFLLFSMEQLKLDPDKIPVTFMGDVLKNSPEYELSLKYVRNTSFISRNERLHFSYVMNDLPPHAYSHLFNLELCEL